MPKSQDLSSDGYEVTGQKESNVVQEHNQIVLTHDDEAKHATGEAKGEAAADNVDAKKCDNAHSSKPAKAMQPAGCATEQPAVDECRRTATNSLMDQTESSASASKSLMHMSREDLQQWLSNSAAMKHMYANCFSSNQHDR